MLTIVAVMGNALMDKCIVCEKDVDNHGSCRSNINYFPFSFGSKHDLTKAEITICDDCARFKEMRGIIKFEDYNL